MLATWLVEIYLSKINHLEDIAASESASDDVENYRAERIIIEDDLKQFLQQYRVSACQAHWNIIYRLYANVSSIFRTIWTKQLFSISLPVMAAPRCCYITHQLLAIIIALSPTG